MKPDQAFTINNIADFGDLLMQWDDKKFCIIQTRFGMPALCQDITAYLPSSFITGEYYIALAKKPEPYSVELATGDPLFVFRNGQAIMAGIWAYGQFKRMVKGVERDEDGLGFLVIRREE